MHRVCTEHAQSMHRVCTEYAQSMHMPEYCCQYIDSTFLFLGRGGGLVGRRLAPGFSRTLPHPNPISLKMWPAIHPPCTGRGVHSPHVVQWWENGIFKFAGELGDWSWELGAGSWELGAVSNDTVSAAGTSIWRPLQGKL